MRQKDSAREMSHVRGQTETCPGTVDVYPLVDSGVAPALQEGEIERTFGRREEDAEDRWTFQIGNEIGLVETNREKSSTWSETLAKQRQKSNQRLDFEGSGS